MLRKRKPRAALGSRDSFGNGVMLSGSHTSKWNISILVTSCVNFPKSEIFLYQGARTEIRQESTDMGPYFCRYT